MSLDQVLILLLGYLLGAIPFGYILTRKYTGLNILEHGSGNIGSTNVGRVAGKKIAFLVQILDMLKGFVPVLAILFSNKSGLYVLPDYFIFAVAASTILGHNFSIFLRFKGGKGVNTTLGASVLIAPIEVFCAVGVYFIVKRLFRFTSVGSMALAITLPATNLILHAGNSLLLYLLFCCIMIIIRHASNVRRLFSENEIL